MITIVLLVFLSLGVLWLGLQWLRYSKRFNETLNILIETQHREQSLQTEMKLLQDKIHHTEIDTVTNLPNWQIFEDRLRQALKEAERYQLVLALLVIDLDEFKLVNDIADYKAGDGVLQEVGRRLQRSVRQVDSVSRFGKDTFVVMITRLAKPETAAIVAQRILQTLVQPFEVKNELLRITASIGIATYPQDGMDGAALMLAGQHALHVAKDKGIHRYEFFQPEMYSLSRRILLLSSSLNSEGMVQELTLRYQPIVNTSTEEVVGMDTLLSWEHTDLGKIEMAELLQLAEKQQKLALIVEWLLTASCQEFMRWRTLGFRSSLLAVSIPISLLQHSPFVCRISQIMKTAGFDPGWLLLQINANRNQMSYDVLEKSFNMLRYLGVKFAYDDFGSGGLSLWQLKQFPVNYFKLDKVLVNDIVSNPQTAVLVQSTLELAKSLGAELIVQGVETPEQLALLKQAGCILMEGKAIGSPLSEGEFTFMK